MPRPVDTALSDNSGTALLDDPAIEGVARLDVDAQQHLRLEPWANTG